ncbi:hypothetical protein [Aureimonas leprariae]|uniref:Uncharacterized protein n=1 Tax=Plantimonas leprariae TaxID=2615207 RepID=A0A7V7TVL7_9HYPH|nr:hypothetical protein [Aureimonas leprariae]KAB0678071.1 hypothetical protein F6X38_16735 [Aureimonas leprariae]
MTTIKDDPIFRSPNGDDWLIRTDPETSKMSVVHRPNASSGGQESVMPVDEFLERGGHSPEVEMVRKALQATRG